MFRRRRVRHSYPEAVVDLVVRLVPVHGALALSRMLDIPKSVIYRWRTTNTGAPPAAPADLATLLERCEQSGFPIRRHALATNAPAAPANAAASEAPDAANSYRSESGPADAARSRAPDRSAAAGHGTRAAKPSDLARRERSRRPYVYAADRERPMRGVRSRMEAVRETLDTRYFLDVDCRSLAESAGMSHFHFIRVFRAMYGTSPHQYLTRIRVEAAKRLLLGSTEPIEVIAVGVGFRSGPSMSRAFKRIEGASASRYFQAP